MFVCDSAMDCAGARLRTYKSCRCVVTSAVAAQSTKQQMLPQPFSHLRSPCLSQHLSVLTFPSKPVPTSGPIGDLHYMSMEQASQKPFTDEHQPSVKHRAANRSRGAATGGVAIANRGSRSGQNKMYHSNYVRGVVECKDCLKPRVLFSITAPSRMVPCAEVGESAPTPRDIARCREYALHQLEVAQESEIYTCGMQPFDSDHPFHDVIYARKELLCSDPMEVEYYNHTKQKAAWFDENLCAYCAGVNGEGFIDKELLGEWKSLLPVCQSCRDEGAPPLVRSKKRNGAANSHAQQRRRLAANAANERAAAQQQQQNVGSGASGAAASSSEVAGSSRAALQPRNRRRGRQSATAPSPPHRPALRGGTSHGFSRPGKCIASTMYYSTIYGAESSSINMCFV